MYQNRPIRFQSSECFEKQKSEKQKPEFRTQVSLESE